MAHWLHHPDLFDSQNEVHRLVFIGIDDFGSLLKVLLQDSKSPGGLEDRTGSATRSCPFLEKNQYPYNIYAI